MAGHSLLPALPSLGMVGSHLDSLWHPMLPAGTRIPWAAQWAPPQRDPEAAAAAWLCPCHAPRCQRLLVSKGTGRTQGLPGSRCAAGRDVRGGRAASEKGGAPVKGAVGKQGSKNARASQEQSLLLPSPSHGTLGHGSHSWGHCAAPGCISLCWGVLGTADSKAEGPNSAQYPPNEGQRDSSMQGEAQPGAVSAGEAATAAAIRAARTAFRLKASPNPAPAAPAQPGWQGKHPVCPSAGMALPDPTVLMFAKSCLQRQMLTSACLCSTSGGQACKQFALTSSWFLLTAFVNFRPSSWSH